ncbi:hypothetical protein L226DRAFT_456563 [Lentinus tigrinus ALCF2SS1-7]|uniref:uncharacterized protein n=1 Tax=Lentinus tigrinus ALCF2SS1-7 TaxID=1328758 RepID=UPI00116625E5|nr:hypothetical protein L226DRAFT_456563 [Lentinus tigrinus ALCF2SS1-7]
MLFCPLSPSDAVSPRDSDIAAGIASDASARPTSHPTIIDFPGLMAVQSRILDALLAHSAAGSELSLGVKHAELAVQDLLFLVRTSNLAEKTALARTIEEFATDAKVAGRLLQHFSSKLDGTVDTVLAFNEFALHVLDDMRQPGMVDRQNTMMEVFESALDTLASQVAGVEVDASIALAALDALGDRLMLVQALCEHEFLSNGQYPSATSFWSMITGDVPERRQLAYRLEVLNNLDAYRRRSLAYITATTQTLVMIESDVSELHRKLVAPQSEAGELPIDVHIATIERSARRLNDERVRRGSRMGITGSAVDNLEV